MTESKSEHSQDYIDSPPEFITDAADVDILTELMQREPIFHHPEFGRTRQELENMTDAAFWEIGASGRRYSRDYTLTEVAKRYQDSAYCGIHSAPENTWQTKDFYCCKIATDNYLLTYTLIQSDRVTRRTTLWRRANTGWKILYHQGTIFQDE
ncbi:hypothetical protein [Chamaesiphon sp. GL140_3_metabinner_50]|uniref:nuclear transport factor 2 family protein n=1 Tax=Chamaesiphon sp. GL140_3_metabinner_50 TaxID=2970812 RepID=UPI0025FD58DA|nr:hypothetical protein [Chamaesiphon sp. GL140_3_metabinner_50]